MKSASASSSSTQASTKPNPTLQRFVDAAIFDQKTEIKPGEIVFELTSEGGRYKQLPDTAETIELPFPATNKDKNSFGYMGAGITFFSPPKNRQTDKASVVIGSVKRDKNAWIQKQTAVMEELRAKHASTVQESETYCGFEKGFLIGRKF